MSFPAPGRGLELRFLGGFHCARDGQAVVGMAYDKMRALLAYLAVSRAQDHRRDTLAELFWSGADAATARGNLRRTLSDLRRVLEPAAGPPLFAVTKHTIRFLPHAWIDTVAFTDPAPPPSTGGPARLQQLERQVDLYRGEFLAGLDLPGCPDFERWLLGQRDALHSHALALLEALANGHEADGHPAAALPFARRCAELAPWDEAAHRRLMRLHALGGQPGAALAQFDACAALLQQDLGLAPDPRTCALAEQIRSGALTPAAAPAERPRQQPERRQVTVLYGELVAIGTDDPDDALDLLRAPRAQCVQTLQAHGGFLVPQHGGGLLAYFGYPLSHGDSAQRAVQAALAMARAPAPGVALRLGVHTGLVLTGLNAAWPDAVGRTTGIAIQLRRIIDGHGVVISQATQALVAGYFICTSLGEQVLPALARPLEVFRVERETGARSRLDAAAQLTPLVGRQAELARLGRHWQDAQLGASGVVCVLGEPAIGKSRLVHAFRQGLADQPHVLRELRCFPEDRQSPYQPLLGWLDGALGLAAGDPPAHRWAQLAQHVARCCPAWAQEALPLLGALAGLPPAAADAGTASAAPPAPLPRSRMHEILWAVLRGPPATLPMLLVVEDLHWADPSTLELLQAVAALPPEAGRLVVCTARPDFAPPLAASLLPLGPLADSAVQQLVAAVRADLPATAVRRIVARADGVPLFAEELARTALPDDATGIPGTLQDVLAARIDSLGDARVVAQLAATIGRVFSTELLQRLVPADAPAVALALSRLRDAGLVEPAGAWACQFRHTLIQEAAYQSQTRADRQAAHRRIARCLQDGGLDAAAARPELLAHHLFSAGEILPAIDGWIGAGQRALQASANLEAVAHFGSAWRSLLTLPAGPDRDQTELAILLGLGPALHATQGYGSEEATRVTARAAQLRQASGNSAQTRLAEWTRLRNTLATRGPLGVPEAALRLIDLAAGDLVDLQAAHYVAAVANFWLGAFAASRQHAEQAIALYQPQHHQPMLARYSEDLSVSFAGHLSWALCFLGRPAQAQAVADRMLAQARAMDHPKTLAMALLFASMLPRWLNQHGQTMLVAAEAMAVTRQHGMPHWTATSDGLQRWARVMQDGRQDLAELQAMAGAASAEAPAYAASRLLMLAEACVRLRRFDQALGLLGQAQAAITATGTHQSAAETQRLTGECLRARPVPDMPAAEACFEQALATSRQQGALLLELRAATSLAQLWHDQGRQAQARQLLAAVQGRFTEGFELPDLVAAARLLRAVAAP